MEINRCQGCMSEFRGYPCPDCGYDPAKAQKGAFVLPPETILAGKYLVGRVLGQGGFGITYIGWDLALERKVAIKEYYPSGQVSRMPGTRRLIWSESQQALSARQDGMQMFLKEARKMAKLEDIPGVVKVRELFQENETAYIVMDFVEGRTLKSILQTSGPMPWEQAKAVFLPAIQAMEKVHAAGLVHRDLSPDNLMITPDGKVRILDLGAAKDLSVNSGASSMQVAKGGFSPYEQYTQRGGSGTWTDVYAMAATIYYTLTGKIPPVAMDRMEEDTLRWDYPGLLALPAPALEALKKAMAIMAKQRTQTMAELEQGLFRLAAKPKPPRLEPRPIPEPKQNSKRETPKWLIPVVAAVVLVAGIGLWAKVVKPANDYKAAQKLMDNGEYDKAAEAFEALGDYQDSAAKAQEANYQAAQALMNAGEYDKAAEAFKALGDYQDSTQKAKDARQRGAYQEAQALLDAGEYAKAAEAFEALGDYQDSAQKAEDARQLKAKQEAYQEAQTLMNTGKYLQAFRVFSALDYKDSARLSQEAKESYWATQQLQLAAGFGHTVGLRSDGTVLATDWNDYGQCDVGGWTDIVAVAAGAAHTVGLRSDGAVVATGWNKFGQCNISGWTDIVAVAAGNGHTVGLRSDGTVVATGDNTFGQCDVSLWTDIVAVAAGTWHTVGLRSDGTVVATKHRGEYYYGQCNVSGWTDIVVVAAGDYHTVGLRSDGTVVTTGSNGLGECGVNGWRDIVAVAAGDRHTVGLRSDGTVVATGGNGDGQCDVSGWTDIVAVAAGDGHTVGLRSDGTVVATGATGWGQCNVSGWKDIRIPK